MASTRIGSLNKTGNYKPINFRNETPQTIQDKRVHLNFNLPNYINKNAYVNRRKLITLNKQSGDISIKLDGTPLSKLSTSTRHKTPFELANQI